MCSKDFQKQLGSPLPHILLTAVFTQKLHIAFIQVQNIADMFV